MQYPVRSLSDWDNFGRLPLAKRIRLYLRSRRFHKRAKRRQDVTIEKVQSATTTLGPKDVVLICVARNAATYVPSYLAHYRRLGVKRFAFLDDRSDDQTRALLAQPDVDLYTSNVDFRSTGGGLLWRDMLVDMYGRDRWYISLDSDEYLIYPGCEARPISAFIGDLERQGLKRSMAVMLDIYPDRPLAQALAHDPIDAAPTACCPLHDGDGYTVSDEALSTAVRGGPRRRLFDVDMRMSKFPVIFADKRTHFNSGSHHAPIPTERNFGPVSAVLLHYKFPNDAVKEFHRIADQGTHAKGAGFYKAIVSHDAFGEDMDLRYSGSVRFTNSETLVANGYMKDLRLPSKHQ